MANYLIAALRTRQRPPVERWLARFGATGAEHRFHRVDGGFVLVVTREPGRCIAGSSFFRGTAVAADGRLIGFGRAGFDAIVAGGGEPSELGGEFVHARWSFRELVAHRDLFGVMPMLVTEGEGVVAASDSLLVLAELRRALGLPVDVDREAAIARTRTLALGLQQMSSATLVAQIRLQPVGTALRVGFDANGFAAERVGAGAVALVRRSAGDYAATVRGAAGNIAGQLRAITAADVGSGLVPMLSLTGGYDSRLLLAAAVRAGHPERLFIETHDRTPANHADFRVATALAEARGLPVNRPEAFEFGAPLEFGASAASVWASSHLGVYDRLVPTTAAQRKPHSVPMNGLGAGIAKGAYGWSTAAGVEQRYLHERDDASAFAGIRAEAFAAQFRTGLAELGVDADDPGASEWHYLGYRNGLHGGAHLSLNLHGLRPLTQRSLAALAHLKLEAGDAVAHAQLLPDLLSVMHREIAAFPYSEEEKTIEPEEALARRERLGGPLGDDEIAEVRIVGVPADAVDGPIELGLRIAERAGFDVAHDARSLLALAEGFVDGIVDPELRGIHRELLELAVAELERPGRRPADAGGAPAKVLSAVLLG